MKPSESGVVAVKKLLLGSGGGSLKNSLATYNRCFLKGQSASSRRKWGNNRSVMPLDVRGYTRVTLIEAMSFKLAWPEGAGESCETLSWQGLIIVIIGHERGIPSKRKSPAYADYVPGLCTHRPSLLPIGCSGEFIGCGRAIVIPLPARGEGSSRENTQTLASRGRRSRNKVSVGEPAEGSLAHINIYKKESGVVK